MAKRSKKPMIIISNNQGLSEKEKQKIKEELSKAPPIMIMGRKLKITSINSK